MYMISLVPYGMLLHMCWSLIVRDCFGKVVSGPVRSECLTCTFIASCCNARLSRAQIQAFAGSSVRDRNQKGQGLRGEQPALAGTREYKQSDRSR